MVKALARAHRWERMLESGKHRSITELAESEKITGSYLSRILRLPLLAPDIVEAILDGRQPKGLKLASLLRGMPVAWEEQRQALCAWAAARDNPQPRHRDAQAARTAGLATKPTFAANVSFPANFGHLASGCGPDLRVACTAGSVKGSRTRVGRGSAPVSR
jgi:hypothetical protein